ncbi:hypothetical protein ASG90_16800 [Nocardioides sp. Soil797]|nr:hypothetical protein ASG90_16800 [Nocardioides sp. Soil797]
MSAPKRLALVLAVLLVVGGAVAAIVWSTTSDEDPSALPDRIGDWVAQDSDAFLASVDADLDDDRRDELIETRRQADDYNSEQFSKAFGGADAQSRSYWSDDADNGALIVVEIQADSGPVLPIAFGDPELMGTAVPRDEVGEHGDVQCLLSRINPPRANEDEDTGDAETEDAEPDSVLCQRTDSGRTVRVSVSGVSVDDVVAITNQVWDR